MISFQEKNNSLYLVYVSWQPFDWVKNNFNIDQPIVICNVYSFKKEDLYIEEDIDIKDIDFFNTNTLEFEIAIIDGDYYKFKKRVLSVTFDLFIQKDIKIYDKMFRAKKNIPIFKKINKVIDENIYISSIGAGNFPITEFERLLKSFPNSYELTKYADARVGMILRDYFESSKDVISGYEKYMNKKYSHSEDDIIEIVKDAEKSKYTFLLDRLKKMLEIQEEYNEKQWQREIYQIVLLLNSKYICVFEEVPLKDTYNNKMRSLDFMLVDSNGNTDIIEIKRPFNQKIISKNTYRDNHIPLRELSGSIMQIEKYIFYLNKWGKNGEDYLNDKYINELPANLKIKITNPNGIVIMGRQNDLSDAQIDDFEVIKRKYRNIIDIVSYDELILRLERMIEHYK